MLRDLAAGSRFHTAARPPSCTVKVFLAASAYGSLANQWWSRYLFTDWRTGFGTLLEQAGKVKLRRERGCDYLKRSRGGRARATMTKV